MSMGVLLINIFYPGFYLINMIVDSIKPGTTPVQVYIYIGTLFDISVILVIYIENTIKIKYTGKNGSDSTKM
jgi:hypothetical protein